jgi:hypothetical protein
MLLFGGYIQTYIGGATMYAWYAEAYPLVNLGMLSIPTIRPHRINFSSNLKAKITLFLFAIALECWRIVTRKT